LQPKQRFLNITDLRETLSYHRGVVFLCIAIFINSVGMGVIAPVLPLFADQEFGVNRTQVGLAVGLHGMGRIFVSLPAGYLTQRYGRRFVLLSGTAINLAGASMVALSFNYNWLLIWRMVSGMGSSMYTTVVSVYLQDVATPENRARFLSLHEISILAGQIIGPAAGGVIGQLVDLRTPLYLQAVLILTALILSALFIPETRPQGSRPQPAARQSPARVRRSATAAGWRSLLLNPGFTFVGLFALMIVANRQGGRFSIMPLFGEAKGFGPNQLGAFISVTHFPQFFTTIAAGFLSDRFGRKFTIMPATVLIVLGIGVFVFGSTFFLLLLSGVLLGLGEGLAGPPSVAFFADISPPGMEGVTMGLFRTFGGLGSLVGALLLGGVADLWGFSWSLAVDASLLFIAAVGMVLLVRETAGRRARAGNSP
jgi:MFS family permease